MKQSKGFTVVEIIVVIVILLSASLIFFMQRNAIAVAARDDERKTDINSMYYALEKVYYPIHQSYPRTLNSSTLSTIDPANFIDPSENTIGASDSDYRYEPTGCSEEACSGYSLRSSLENEADYIKTNPKN